jgi:hypothetical protein
MPPQLDFPASPTDGQVFSAANGVTYQYKATPGAWLATTVVTGGVKITVASTAPSSPVVNDLWVDTT